ncbi:MAG TPA: hypothetical protein VER58_16120 [Thermoanaerobaculia bacterium]|nr:hypothetical protein [Thermoanaerobaculia bacterium]
MIKEWDSFYVIIGSSAAALTGLQFVVIALVAEARTSRTPEAVEAFGTPTIVHFCAVLLLAAVLTTPRHTVASLTACLVAIGGLGLIYVAKVIIMALRQRGYKPVLEDWIWHGVLPIIAYAWLFAAGWLTPRSTEIALYCVAGAALMLLFIGIHNAWDTAVFMTTAKPRRKSRL